MADQKISDLPDGGLPQPTDDFVVARGATNNKIAWSSMSAATAAGGVAVAASNTTYTSGTVTITGVGGGVTVSSNTGQRVDISVAAPVAQTVQTQNVVDVTLSGNTAGALALVSSGTLTIAGGNNITLSQNGNAVTISGANAAGAQTAISGISASDTLYTSGTVRFTGVGGGITVSTNTGQRIDLSVAAQSVQPETQTFIGGVSASDTLYTSGSVRFTGSQAVTVRSGTGQLVVIDVPAQTTQVETQTFVGGIAASNATYTSGTVTITGVGGGVTVSSNTGQRVDISVAAQSVQTQDVLSVGASTGGNTSGNTTVNTGSRLVFAGGNNITISQGTAAGATTLTISGPNVGGAQTGISGIANSETTYTSGSVTMSALGAITIRSTTGQHLQFSVNSQTAQTGISGIANSQTTYTSGTVSLSELGAITIRSTTGNQYQFSVNSQTAQTQGILNAGVSTGGNTSGNTTVNSGSRLVFAGGNNITLSQGTAADATTITISAGAGGAGLSAGMSTNGNTAGDTGLASQRLVLVGSNNITLSGSTNAGSMSLSIIGPTPGAAQFSVGVSTGGNTAGSTGVTGTRIVHVGVSPITLSQSTDATGATISVNAPATSSLSATGAVSLSTNGSTISIGAPNSSLISATGAVSVSTNGSTISIGAPLAGTVSMWPVMPQSTVSGALASHFATAATRTSMTALVAPFAIEAYLSGNQMRVPAYVSISTATTNSNWSWTAGHSMGIYTLTGNTLSLLSSFSHKQQISYASTNNSTNASATWSASWGSGTDLSASLSLSTNNAGATGLWSSISSMKLYPMFSGAVSMSPGQYWNAWVFSSASAGAANCIWTGVGLNVAVSSQQAAQDIGQIVTLTTGTHPLGGQVSMTQTNTAMPVSFLTADMTTSGAAAVQMNRSVYMQIHTRFA